MIMILKIVFPKNLITESVLKQNNIPCIIRVADDFEVVFQEPLFVGTGKVDGWDRSALNERAVSRVGGKYTHYAFGMISLDAINAGQYRIMDLSIFIEDFGWCIIMANGEYGRPRSFGDSAEDTVNLHKKIPNKRR